MDMRTDSEKLTQLLMEYKSDIIHMSIRLANRPEHRGMYYVSASRRVNDSHSEVSKYIVDRQTARNAVALWLSDLPKGWGS